MNRTRAATASLIVLALGLAAGCHPFRSDVGRLCDAEQLSQLSLKANRSQIFIWMERHVASSEAINVVRDLEGKDLHNIAIALRGAALKAGVRSCALAEHADMLGKDQDYLTDMTNLCAGSAPKDDGSIAHLDIYAADEPERMRELTEWTRMNARSADTPAFVAKLVAAPPSKRGTMLRAESGRVGVASCLMASTLDSQPRPPPPPPGPEVNPNFMVMKVTGAAANQSSIAVGLFAQPQAVAINTCYAAALVTNPKLKGKLSVELTFDITGHKVVKATDDDSALKGPVVKCIVDALGQMLLDKPLPERPKKGGAKATATLLLTPSTSGPGYGASVDPTWLSKTRSKHR